MLEALKTPRAGEWQHCQSALRDTPVGLCEGPCRSLCQSGMVFFETLPSGATVARVVICDECLSEVLADA